MRTLIAHEAYQVAELSAEPVKNGRPSEIVHAPPQPAADRRTNPDDLPSSMPVATPTIPFIDFSSFGDGTSKVGPTMDFCGRAQLVCRRGWRLS